MEFRLALRDHPQPEVTDQGLTHRDPYFTRCWRPLLDPWAHRLLAQVAAITAQNGDVRLSTDQLARALDPRLSDRRAQQTTLKQAIRPIGEAVLGHHGRVNRDVWGITVYRNVPLLADPVLTRLTDHELATHARTLVEVNQRREAAGHEPYLLPDWARERVGRLSNAPYVTSADAAPPLLEQRRDAVLYRRPTSRSSTAEARLDALTAAGERILAVSPSEPDPTASSQDTADAPGRARRAPQRADAARRSRRPRGVLVRSAAHLHSDVDRVVQRHRHHVAAGGDREALASFLTTEICEDQAGRAAARAAIEDTLRWSQDALGQLVNLGPLLTLLEHGGWSSEVGRRLMAAADQVEARLGALPSIIERLRAMGEHLATLEIDQDAIYEAVTHRLGETEAAPGLPGDAIPSGGGDGVADTTTPEHPDPAVQAVERLDALRRQSNPEAPGVAL